MNTHTLTADNISLAYAHKTIIENLSLTINRPQMISIIGPNGAGKSTLLKGLSRILPPSQGQVLLDGKDIHTAPGKLVASIMSFLPQSAHAPANITVKDLVGMGRTPYVKRFAPLTADDRAIITAAMEQTSTVEFQDRTISTLSGGERQRVWLAMALAQQPSILMLDEPTTFLDIHHQIEIMELVKRLHQSLQLTVIMVLHDLNHALRYSDRIIAVKQGKIFADGPVEQVLTEENFAHIYNVRARKVVIQEDGCVYPFFLPLSNTK